MFDIFDDESFQRQIILENYKKPQNRGLLEDNEYQKVHMDSESCIDDIYIQLKKNNNIIDDIRFDGEACTISTSSASIMTKLLKGKTIDDAKEIITNFNNMIFEKSYNKNILEEANVFQNIYLQPNRIKCALLPWDGVKKILEEESNE
ncbi:MAG: Fe-S cluster assembly sulfur transfer protein SufU [Bacilli bacterium]